MTDLYEIDTRAEDLVLAMIDAGIFGSARRRSRRAGAGSRSSPGTRRGGARTARPDRRHGARPRARSGPRYRVSAHRIVYRYLWGAIPAGHAIDHVNRKRDDNHPRNLEAVTQGENVRRAVT